MAVSFMENGLEDDEYIDMEITSFSNFFSNSRNSREFEFHMSSLSIERDSTTSPADELFYNGKLLPLHLPPHLLRFPGSGSVYSDKNGVFDEFYGTPLATSTTTVTTPTSTSTPFESCNISPCDSCSVSRELNPDEYSSLLFKYSSEAEESRCIRDDPKKSWTKKLKLPSKLKASRAYLKAFFGKSGCAHESSAMTKDVNVARISKPKERHFRNINEAEGKEKLADKGNVNRHRRSFSMARYSSTKKSSTSLSSSTSSSNSNGSILQFLKRSSSVNVEIESPIQGAIAHCKRSQMSSRKTVDNIGVFEDQERPDLCRGY